MQLLDCAQTIILERGLSSFTMEALAREAGVSNPLVYKYFATRLAILQELLLRETKRFNTQLQAQVTQAQDYQELITLVVSVNFEQFSKNNIVYILRDQPDVFEAIAVDDRKQSSVMGRFLVQTLADQYTIDRKQAEQMVVLASGASQAAAAHYNRYGGDQAAMINDTVQFIFGGIDALLP
jgi:AcrR family transcriptional regulator